jgi:hypothetical protein
MPSIWAEMPLERLISALERFLTPFARKGKMEPVMEAVAKVVFRIFRALEPVGEGRAFGGQVLGGLEGQTRRSARTTALAARWLDMMLAVKLSFRASG